MKTAISIPDKLYENIEDFLKVAHISRSEFFQRAARFYLKKVSGKAIADNLSDVYRVEETPGDSAFRRAAITHFRELLEEEE
jgi:hypothetical protein